MPELGLFQWIVGGIVAGGLAVAAFLWGCSKDARDKADMALDKAKENELATARLQLHISENYSTKADSQTMQQQMTHNLDRIHMRIDEIPTREEITALLRK